MNAADQQMAYELGLHAGQKALESMQIALQLVPRGLGTQATAVAIAFIRHRLTAIMAEVVTRLGSEGVTFAAAIDAIEAHFDQLLLEHLKAQKGQQNNAAD